MAETDLIIKIIADNANFKKVLKELQSDIAKVNKDLSKKEQLNVAKQVLRVKSEEIKKQQQEDVRRARAQKQEHAQRAREDARREKVQKQEEAKREAAYKREVARQEKIRRIEEKKTQHYKDQNKFSKGLFGDSAISWRSKWSRPEDRKGPFGGTVTKRGLGEATSSVGKTLTGVAGGIIGFAVAGVMAGYQKFLQRELAVGKLSGVAARGGQISQALGGSQAGRYGFNSAEAAGMLPAMARNTGVLNPRQMFQAMRATGMEAGEVGGVFKSITGTGASFATPKGGGESAGMKTFTKMMAGAQAAGLEHAEIPEHLEQVVTAINEMKESLVEVNVDSVNKQLAMLGRVSPAMAHGGNIRVAMGVHKAFTSPGGGEWGQALMRGAMGFGTPGGTTGFYQAERMRQQGVNDPKNVPRLLNQLKMMFPNAESRAYAGSQALGLSMEQYDDLEKAYKAGNQDLVSKIIESAKPIEEQSLAAMKGILGETKRQAGLFEKGVKLGEQEREKIEKLEDVTTDMLPKILTVLDAIYDVIAGWIGDKGGSAAADAAIKASAVKLSAAKISGSGRGEQASYYADIDKEIAKGYKKGGGEETPTTSALVYFKSTTKDAIDALQAASGYAKLTKEAAAYITQGISAVTAPAAGGQISTKSLTPVSESYYAQAKTAEQKAAVKKIQERLESKKDVAHTFGEPRVVNTQVIAGARGIDDPGIMTAGEETLPGEPARIIDINVFFNPPNSTPVQTDGVTVNLSSKKPPTGRTTGRTRHR